MFAMPPRNFTLEVLSPVHIGTGETLDPLSYSAFKYKDMSESRVEIYDLAAAVQAMPASMKAKLESFVTQNNHVGLRDWMAEEFSADIFAPSVLRNVAADDGLYKIYRDEIDQKKSSLEIHPAMVSPVVCCPIIPGSSIKGALRTAWLKRLAKVRGIQKGVSPRDFEKTLMGDPREDPFRMLSVADVELPTESLCVTRVVNVRQGGEVVSANPGSGQTFRMFYEVIQPHADGHPTQGSGKLAWSVRPQIQNSLTRGSVPQSLEKLLEAAREDARHELEREVAFFNGGNHAAGALAGRLLKLMDSLKPNQSLLKLGRFGGVFSKTIDDIREPKTRMGRDRKPLPWGKTRFVVEAKSLPERGPVSCGWCCLTV
jgi:hypothetical protein